VAIDGEALGQSASFLEFQEQLSQVAPVERPVLLIGERGTGKELAAHRLHYLSKRWERPFITLNCAALSPSLIESELFGHDKGAFTGAEKQKTGRFEAAGGGTLFLDEIGAIPHEAQEKILRVVEYGTFERVGSSSSIEVDVRIVGATNENLPELADSGVFKRDLLDRLSFEVLFLPPLRCRGEDIMLLAHNFAARMSFELGRDEVVTFDEHIVKSFEEHDWKGNIRELKNVVERAVYRSDSGDIDSVVFNPFINPYPLAGSDDQNVEESGCEKNDTGEENKIVSEEGVPYKEAIHRFEVSFLRDALEKAHHNQRKAASSMGLTYDQFRGKVRKYSSELFP
jgi:psp operon transcriptional activator